MQLTLSWYYTNWKNFLLTWQLKTKYWLQVYQRPLDILCNIASGLKICAIFNCVKLRCLSTGFASVSSSLHCISLCRACSWSKRRLICTSNDDEDESSVINDNHNDQQTKKRSVMPVCCSLQGTGQTTPNSNLLPIYHIIQFITVQVYDRSCDD